MRGKRDIRMSEQEIAGFLTDRSDAMVLALPGEGAPLGGVGGFRYLSPQAVEFSLPTGHPLLAHLRADPRACCVVEQFPSYFEIKGVMLHGHAGTLNADDSTVWFHLRVDKVVSFDFGKLQQPAT